MNKTLTTMFACVALVAPALGAQIYIGTLIGNTTLSTGNNMLVWDTASVNSELNGWSLQFTLTSCKGYELPSPTVAVQSSGKDVVGLGVIIVYGEFTFTAENTKAAITGASTLNLASNPAMATTVAKIRLMYFIYTVEAAVLSLPLKRIWTADV